MTTGAQLVRLAERYFGRPYRFGAENPPTAFDCSEYVEFLTHELGALTVPDGAFYQWRHCEPISVDRAMEIPGALLFVGDGVGVGREAIVHVAISRGDQTTAEARGSRWGTGTWSARGRFNFGGLLPELAYGKAPQADLVESVLRRMVRANPSLKGRTSIEAGSALREPLPGGGTTLRRVGTVGGAPIGLRRLARRFVDEDWSKH